MAGMGTERINHRVKLDLLNLVLSTFFITHTPVLVLHDLLAEVSRYQHMYQHGLDKIYCAFAHK